MIVLSTYVFQPAAQSWEAGTHVSLNWFLFAREEGKSGREFEFLRISVLLASYNGMFALWLRFNLEAKWATRGGRHLSPPGTRFSTMEAMCSCCRPIRKWRWTSARYQGVSLAVLGDRQGTKVPWHRDYLHFTVPPSNWQRQLKVSGCTGLQ